MKVICVRWGRWASVATKSKIGSCKSAGDYSELPWINRHMSISEWEAHCLLLYFSASYVIQFYMLDNGMLVFFVIGVIMKEISAIITWFMETVKYFENLKHLRCCTMDMFFCYILHWVLWNNFSCFLKFNFGKVLLFLVDYDHYGIMSKTVNHLPVYQTVIELINCIRWRVV